MLKKTIGFIKKHAADIQTRPDWMGSKTVQAPNVSSESLDWVRIIPYAGNKYEVDKLPSKLGGLGGAIVWRFYRDEQGAIGIYVAHKPNSNAPKNGLQKALRQRLPHTDLQSCKAPPNYEAQEVKRLGDLAGVLSDSGNLAAILDSLENESYLELMFEQRNEQEFKSALKGRSSNGASNGSGRADVDPNLTVLGAWGEMFGISSKNKAPKKTAPKEEIDKEKEKRVNALLNESSSYFSVSLFIGTSNGHHRQMIFNELNNQMKKSHHLSLNASAKGILWREQELAVLVAIPDMSNKQMIRAVTHLRQGERTLDDDALTDGVAVGRLIHPTKPKRLVAIPLKQFLRHYFLSGKNGSGKSSTAVQMIQSLLEEWVKNNNTASGFTYVDPAGSTLTIILNRLLHMEQQGATIPWDKVHYIDLTPDSEYPVGLNLLYHLPGEEVANVAGGALDVIKSVFGGDAIFTDRLLENAMMTLLYDTRRTHTILGVTSILQFPAMREDIKILDPLVREFWDMTGEDLKPDKLNPLLNRLRPLLQNPNMRRIFGQAEWTLKIREWMDDGHIVLINVKNLEPKNMGLVGGQILTRYHVIAKTRPEDISKPHMLMIDEAHNVKIPILEKVVAEDRKFGLSLGLITQYPEQFDGGIKKAISENMGTFLSCTAGPDSAAFIAKMVNNAFEPKDLQGLSRNTVAAYSEIDGEAISFLVKSDPPVMYMQNGQVADFTKVAEQGAAQEWAIAKAQELAARDGVAKESIDKEVAEYMNWLKQFREEDEEGGGDGGGKGKSSKGGNGKAPVEGYQPKVTEQGVLDAIVALAEDRVEWEGTTSELLQELDEFMDMEGYTAIKLGLLLQRADAYLGTQGVKANKHKLEKGNAWRLFVE